jgi:hypothetical protein
MGKAPDCGSKVISFDAKYLSSEGLINVGVAIVG